MTNDVLRIFMSYRRRDVRGYAGWLRYCIAPKYGENNIFRDIERIGGGQDFMERIDRAIRNCHVVLVLLGDEWATITHRDGGGRRLDDPDDPVRLEVEAAFRHKRQVVPILVEGAPMPLPGNLPDSLSRLVRLHGLPLTDARWDEDVTRITARLDEIAAGITAPKLKGAQIVERVNSGQQPPRWVGRGGGLRGVRFKEDVETGNWRTFDYEVDFSVEPPNRRAWFSVEDFVAAIEPGV